MRDCKRRMDQFRCAARISDQTPASGIASEPTLLRTFPNRAAEHDVHPNSSWRLVGNMRNIQGMHLLTPANHQ